MASMHNYFHGFVAVSLHLAIGYLAVSLGGRQIRMSEDYFTDNYDWGAGPGCLGRSMSSVVMSFKIDSDQSHLHDRYF